MAPSVQRRKVWLTLTTRVPCSKAAKTRNLLKFAGVPQTCQRISAASRQKCTILRGRVGEILPDCRYCLSCKDIARQSCAMVRRWRFFASFLRFVFPSSRVQHISDMHSKFALRHTMCRSMVDIQSATAAIRGEDCYGWLFPPFSQWAISAFHFS